jgi:hypothetical protein
LRVLVARHNWRFRATVERFIGRRCTFEFGLEFLEILSLPLSIPSLGEDVEDSLPFCCVVVPTWDRQIRDFPSAFLGHFEQRKYTFGGFEDERNKERNTL